MGFVKELLIKKTDLALIYRLYLVNLHQNFILIEIKNTTQIYTTKS